MTFHPHPMTRHDTLSAHEYAEEVMRAELQGGMSILPKHFHILAGLVRAEFERSLSSAQKEIERDKSQAAP